MTHFNHYISTQAEHLNVLFFVITFHSSPVQGNTRKSTLLGSIDKTVTAGGARLLKNRIT